MRRSPETPSLEPPLADLPCACASARRVSRALTQLYDAHLRPAGLESTQFALLSVLAAAGPATQASIGRRFGFDKTTLSRNIRVLRQRGWIEDTVSANARERPCGVTPTGRRQLQAAAPAWRRAQEALRTSLGDAGWQAMWSAFGVITGAARTARQTPARPPRRLRR